LSAAQEYIGYNASATALLQQTNGTNTTSYLSISSKGTYKLSSGTLQINGIGLENLGTLDFNNGSAELNASNAIINFTQGGSVLNSQSATLTIGTNTLLIVPAGYNPNQKFAHFNNSGILHTAGTTLMLSAGQLVYGSGTIADPVVCQGTININTGGTINLDNGLTLSDAGNANLGLGRLKINDTVSGISGGSLTADNEYIGYSANGKWTHSSGNNTVTSSLYLGYNSGSSGIYNLSETGSLKTSYYEYIGYSGTGTFNQTGGTNLFSSDLYLGYNAGSSGTYNLSGAGQLSSIGENIGYSGTGTFSQISGSNSPSSVCLGNNAGSSGTYNLETGSLNTAGGEIIGLSGNGTFNQYSGIHTTEDRISLGYNSGANGTYNQSGGTLTAKNLYLGYNSGASGIFNLETGSVNTANDEYIGFSGNGAFKQTGGTNSISGNLTLGNLSGSTGTYELSGSVQLSASNEFIGTLGKGTFVQNGGTNKITSTLYLGEGSGSNGAYNLGSSGQLSADFEYIGTSGTGTIMQTSGTNTASYIKIGTTGTYTLSSGTLNINGGFENQGICDLSNSSAIINAPSSIVNLSGTVLATVGNVTINLDAHSLLIIPVSSDPANYFAHYNNAGILHHAGSALDISSVYSISGIGSIDDHVNCPGNALRNFRLLYQSKRRIKHHKFWHCKAWNRNPLCKRHKFGIE
jgi:hypothetical protein